MNFKDNTCDAYPCNDFFEKMEYDSVDNNGKKSECKDVERKTKNRKNRTYKNIEHTKYSSSDKIKLPVLESKCWIDLDTRLCDGIIRQEVDNGKKDKRIEADREKEFHKCVLGREIKKQNDIYLLVYTIQSGKIINFFVFYRKAVRILTI